MTSNMLPPLLSAVRESSLGLQKGLPSKFYGYEGASDVLHAFTSRSKYLHPFLFSGSEW